MEFSIRVLGGAFRAAARIACFGYVLKGREKMRVFHVAAKGLGPVLALILGSVVLLSSGCTGERRPVVKGTFEGQQIDKKLAALDLDESQFAVSEVLRDRRAGRVQERYYIMYDSAGEYKKGWEKGWGRITYEHLIDGNFYEIRTVDEGAEALSKIFGNWESWKKGRIWTPYADVKLIRGRIATFYVTFLTVPNEDDLEKGDNCGFFVGRFGNRSFALNGRLCRRGSLTEKFEAEHRTHVEDFLFRMEKH